MPKMQVKLEIYFLLTDIEWPAGFYICKWHGSSLVLRQWIPCFASHRTTWSVSRQIHPVHWGVLP